MKFFIRLFLFSLLLIPTVAYNQTASLLPNAVQQFFDNNGNPLSVGTVDTYVAGTSTRKTTWKNSGETVTNTNPIILDAGGKAIIYGEGTYRQVVKDRNGNIIWDAVTTPASGGGGGGGTATTLPVGWVTSWAGITAPTLYQFAYGQELIRANFPDLFTALTITQNVGCTNTSTTITGLTDTTQIPIGGIVELSCVAPGTTVVSKTTSTVVLSNPSNVSLSASAVFFLYGNGNGSTTFNLPDLRGQVIAGRNNMGSTASSSLTTAYYGTSPDATGARGGTQSKVLISSNLPAYTPTGTFTGTPGTPTGSVSISDTRTWTVSIPQSSADGGTSSSTDRTGAGNTGANTLGVGVATGSISGSFTGSAFTPVGTFTGSAQGGTSTAFSIVQPTITLNYIIKVLPGPDATIVSGVDSIQGMTGILLCGNALNCNSQTIAVGIFPTTIIAAIPNVSGMDASTGLFLDRSYADVGDRMDITWGSLGTGVNTSPRAAAISANATSGGFISFNFYTQASGGDAYSNLVGTLGSSGLILSNPLVAPRVVLAGRTDDTSTPIQAKGADDTSSAIFTGYNNSGVLTTTIRSSGIESISGSFAGIGAVQPGGYPTILKVIDGSAATPITDGTAASFSVYRTQAIVTAPSTQSAGIYVEVIGHGGVVGGPASIGQPVGINAFVVNETDSKSDIAAIQGFAFAKGTGAESKAAFGAFFQAEAVVGAGALTAAIAVETQTTNSTIHAPAFSLAGSNHYIGYDVGMTNSEVGSQVRGQTQVGFAVLNSTVSLAAFISPGFKVDPNGIITGKSLLMPGSGSGTTTIVTQTAAGTPTLTFPTASGTFAVNASSPLSLDATTGNLTCSSCLTNTPSALTKTDDTNVTLTLGGTPATALLQAVSLTLGWTGQLGLTRGGTAASLVASNGGIVYSGASALAILSGTATAGQIIRSGSSAAPSWSTSTYPATSAAGTILASGTANTITASATPTLGIAGTTLGSLTLSGNTSGNVTVTPQAAAGTSIVFTLPNASGTPAISVPSPLALSATTGAISWSGLTSGGVLYASSTTAVSISALLTANQIMLGGGSGAAPTTFACATTTTVVHGGTPPTCSQVAISTDVSGAGTGVITALTNNVGSAGAFVVNGGALGTPTSGVGTNITNVNAATLGGATFASPGAIGSGTPSTGVFTSLTATAANPTLFITVSPSSGTGSIQFADSVTNKYQIGAQSVNDFFIFDNATAAFMLQYTNSANVLKLMPTVGGVAIGAATSPGTGGLLVNGQFYMPNLAATSAAQSGTVCWLSSGSPAGKFTVDTTLGCLASTEEVKNNIVPLDPDKSLSEVMRLVPVSFFYNDGYNIGNTGEQVGFTAEQAATVDERCIARNDEGKLRGYKYQQCTALLASALQALKANNDNLRQEIENLKHIIGVK